MSTLLYLVTLIALASPTLCQVTYETHDMEPRDWLLLQDAIVQLTHEVVEVKSKLVSVTSARFATYALLSGPVYHVTDAAYSASSIFEERSNHGPQCSRMGLPVPRPGCESGAWHKDEGDRKPWMEVDMGAMFEISAVATQGRGTAYSHHWLTSFTLASHDDEIAPYRDAATGNVKVFKGNMDRETVRKHNLAPPLVARKVRIYPVEYKANIGLRVEYFGIPLIH